MPSDGVARKWMHLAEMFRHLPNHPAMRSATRSEHAPYVFVDDLDCVVVLISGAGGLAVGSEG